jgi:hypothetical protein
MMASEILRNLKCAARQLSEIGTVSRACYVKMYFREIGWGAMDWIDMAQDRVFHKYYRKNA